MLLVTTVPSLAHIHIGSLNAVEEVKSAIATSEMKGFAKELSKC
jgi:hypothetical protein